MVSFFYWFGYLFFVLAVGFGMPTTIDDLTAAITDHWSDKTIVKHAVRDLVTMTFGLVMIPTLLYGAVNTEKQEQRKTT